MDKFPKPPANRTAVSKNQFLNSRAKHQPLRQSRKQSRATAANAADAEADAAATKALALPVLLPERRIRFPLRRPHSNTRRKHRQRLSFILLFPRKRRKAGLARTGTRQQF